MTKKIKLRSLLIGGFFTLLFVVLIVKVYWIQVVEASWLLEKAEKRWETDKIITPVRGSIVDRNDKPLAIESTAYTIALDPEMLNNYQIVEDVSQGLADILKDSEAVRAELVNKIRDRATRKNLDGTKLARNVEIRNEGWKIGKDKADQVRELIARLQTKLKLGTKANVGIYILEDKKRYYPNETLAAHILGYTNKEGEPSLGLELKMNDVLKGVPGSMSYEKDGKGVELPEGKVDFKPAEDGSNVRLTIDKNIQYYLESALAKVNDQWHPKSLTAIAVDPKTMEILGMANTPTFNPNTYGSTKDQSAFINRAVSSRYEPGSTFKLVTLAGAVAEGVFNPNEMYQSGEIRVSDRILHDHNNVGWGKISFLDGLKRSSNVAFVKLGIEKLTTPKFKDYIEKFGFKTKTNIDLPSEVSGLIDMQYPSEFATATYGQGKVVVTAIQQTAAYAAIANGGKLMWPHIVKAIVDPKTGKTISDVQPQVIRQVVSPEVASQVSGYLEQVVSDQEIGTGKLAFMDDYRVAGKTGTANIVLPGDKTYSPNTWVISFIGYAPVEDPRILITLIADQPDLGGNYHLGGQVLAPAFKEIAGESLQYLGVPSSKKPAKVVKKETSRLTMPNFADMSQDNAKSIAKDTGLTLDVFGRGDKVVNQFPKAGTEILSTQHTYVAMQDVTGMPLPNLIGKSLRDAVEVCSFFGTECQTSGEGYVTEQGAAEAGQAVKLTLRPIGVSEETTASAPPTSNGDAGDAPPPSPTPTPGTAAKTQNKSKTP
ncbi:penicillin-binding transpeptidase domain-containing protein [Paenibacillus whitsoniae]|uniref:PASTA domain-containing protein n=1 Tax=Paenibacillus whitsoniae TaxID=2496558 RepID=A0A3S0A224_9BACL|nr:penicillin-binding transpeptidase domain-containing protein [Paenibacillus whitsoniae]RTE07685.1 PASTA domain-containing protein [Paenibacillus whitsoniae]